MQSQGGIERRLVDLMTSPNRAQGRLQLAMALAEAATYICTINNITIDEQNSYLRNGWAASLVLISLLLMRYLFSVSLISAVGILLISMTPAQQEAWMIVNLILLGLLYLADLLSSIQLDYRGDNSLSETKNYNKVIHRLGIITNIFLSLYGNAITKLLANGISFVLFPLMLYIKESSIVKCEEYRTITLRFYLYAACEHLRLFLNAYLSFVSTIYSAMTSLLLSQIIFYFINLYHYPLNLKQLLANEDYTRLAFILLRYDHSSIYDAQIEQFIQFLMQKSGEDEEEKLNKAHGRLHTPVHFKQRLSLSILKMLNKSDGFVEAVLCAEVHAESGRLLSAMESLAKAHIKLNNLDWLNRLVLLRAQRRLQISFGCASERVTFINEQQWKSFLSFQELIYKAASQHLLLSRLLKSKQFQLAKIKQSCLKIIATDSQVMRTFCNIKTGFAANIDLFLGFLLLVREDYSAAETVLSQQQLHHRDLLNGCLSEKIFLRLCISPDGLTIDQVGFNSSSLLNYNRDQLQGQPVQRLVPPFFRPQHQRLSTAFVHGSFWSGILFQKQTIILNGRGTYNLCEIAVRMIMRQEEFCYEGYLHVKAAEKHDMNTFCIISANGSLLEWSHRLLLKEQTDNKIRQVFEGTLGETLIRTKNRYLYQRFDSLLEYRMDHSAWYLYAKNIQQNVICKQVLNKIQLEDQKRFEKDEYRDNFDFSSIEETINNKSVIFATFLLFFLICALFGCVYLCAYSASVKLKHQHIVVDNGQFIMQYYNNSFKLGMDANYLDLKHNLNYSNSFWPFNLVDGALRTQAISEYLKGFNRGKYAVPSPNPNLLYNQSNYEIIALFTSNLYLYQQFEDDQFMQESIINSLRAYSSMLFMGSLLDYRFSLSNIFSDYVETDNFYNKLALSANLAIILLLILVAILLFFKIRAIEETILELRCSTFKPNKTQLILSFMRNITLEQPACEPKLPASAPADKENGESNTSFLKSEMSFIREGTGRDILSDALPQSGFVQQIQNDHHQSQQTFHSTDSYKKVLKLFGALMGSYFTLLLINEIQNNNLKDVDEVVSLNTIIILYRASAYYSRAAIHSLNTVLLNNLAGVDSTNFYFTQIATYNTYLQTFAYPQFPQVKLQEFADFSVKLSQLYQGRACDFMNCDPTLKDQLNLNYITVIDHFSTNLSQLVRQTMHMNTSSFISFFNSPAIRHYLDLLFESEQVIRNYLIDLSMNYLGSYVRFMNNLFSSKSSFILGMTIVGMITLTFYFACVWFLKREQWLLMETLKLRH